MNFDDALSYLLSLGHETLTIKLGLANTEKLLSALGDPQKEFPAVQIAGTNGKGSTAVMLDSICRAGGVRTGLFTSPHLASITERIQVAGTPIADADFARIADQVKGVAEVLVKQGALGTLPTFFEHITAIALIAFREKKVELAILETGLGGRLDSTTAAGSGIVGITPIALDHQEYLGQTLTEIASEKAAIIRHGVAAVIAPQDEAALDIILKRCEDVNVVPTLIESDNAEIIGTSEDGRFSATFTTSSDKYENVSVGLRGRHQVTNAATAIALAESLRERGLTISRESILRGIEYAKHPGRLELWPSKPRILLDGAHNPAAARALRNYLDEFVDAKIAMIFGAMRDKSLDEMAAVLFPVVHTLILTEFDNPRAASLEMLLNAVSESFDKDRIYRATSAEEALRLAKVFAGADGLICVTGSLYLVGAIQHILGPESRGIAHHGVGH